MMNVILFALVTLALLAAFYWLSHRVKGERGSVTLPQAVSAEKLLPQHYRYFPQVRQALSDDDRVFLERRASSNARRMALRARRSAALEFLAGLRDDYRRLDRLARTLTALAPVPNRLREAERIRLAIRFEFMWVRIWLRLWTGAAPITQIQHLAELIGTMAVRLGNGMDALHEAAASQSTQLRA